MAHPSDPMGSVEGAGLMSPLISGENLNCKLWDVFLFSMIVELICIASGPAAGSTGTVCSGLGEFEGDVTCLNNRPYEFRHIVVQHTFNCSSDNNSSVKGMLML